MAESVAGWRGAAKENSPPPAPGRGNYRLLCPRTSFRTFFLFEPRGVVRFALGAAFLRAVRFTFLRSAVSSIDFVFAIESFVGNWVLHSSPWLA
jgi:hypothetical protein